MELATRPVAHTGPGRRCARPVFLLLAVLAVSASAQEGWQWRNPQPQGNDVWTVSVLNGYVAGLAGEAGCVLMTWNGGGDGRTETAGRFDIFGMAILSVEQVYVVGEGGRILKSIDTIKTWQPQNSGVTATLRAVQFPDNGPTGFACGDDGTFLATTDGGEHWLSRPVGSGESLFALGFVDALTGWVAGERGSVFATTDGGEHWLARPTGGPDAVRSISLVDAARGHVCGDVGLLRRTTDAGATWQPESLAPGMTGSLRSVHFPAGPDTGYVCGDFARAAQTTDGGATWLNLPMDSAVGNLTALRFSGDTGWAGGELGAILRTTDQGQSWFSLRQGFLTPLYDVVFPLDEQTGYVASQGCVYKSTNYGGEWSRRPVTPPVELRALSFPADTVNGFAVGGQGLIFRTTDGGANWIPESCPGVGGDYVAVSFPAGIQTGYAATGGGRIVKTTDGGGHWFAISAPDSTQPLHTVLFATANNGFAAGPGPLIYRTADGGESWNPVLVPGGGIRSFSFPLGPADGFACGDSGTLIRTTNGGMSWVRLNGGTDVNLHRILFPTGLDTGLVVGENATCLRTQDGGGIWPALVLPAVRRDLWALAFPRDNQHGFVGGERSALFVTGDGGGLSVAEPRAQPGPTGFLTCAPNPFSTRTTITWQVTRAGPLRLRLYDRQGRLVRVLARGTVPAGPGSLRLERTGLANGVYFLRLEHAAGRELRKLVLD